MIYLASPYSHTDKAVEHQRYLDVRKIAAFRTRQGEVVYSPIVYGHWLTLEEGFGSAAADWEMHNMQMLRRCDRLMIATIPGWRESKGVRWEIASAMAMKIPRIYLTAEGFLDYGILKSDPRGIEATL